jgi:hypothetical protein
MIRFICLVCLILSLAPLSQAQETRGIIPVEFAKARPAKGQSPSPAGRCSVWRRTSAKAVTAAKADELSQLGLTIWRLRPATAADPSVRIIVQKESDSIELTPERVSANAPMRIGDNIRFSFESPRTGYLYVINSELYADGSLREPALIFPTMRTRQGDNKVEAGKLIEIPAQEDRPNYFTLQQSRLSNVSQTGESLTVIVAPQPLEGLVIGAKPLTLSRRQVEQWEKQWGSQTETFELDGGAGKAWTKAEQEAGAGGSRYLTQEDPEPQTIYRVAVKPGAPMLVKVRLRYSRPDTASRKSRR